MKAEIFTRPGCGFCVMAKVLMVKRNIAFTERDISNPDHYATMKARVPNARTVPQIFLDGRAIGGFEDLARHLGA